MLAGGWSLQPWRAALLPLQMQGHPEAAMVSLGSWVWLDLRAKETNNGPVAVLDNLAVAPSDRKPVAAA